MKLYGILMRKNERSFFALFEYIIVGFQSISALGAYAVSFIRLRAALDIMRPVRLYGDL